MLTRRSVPLCVLFVVANAFALSACESEREALIRALGEGCVRNSECADGLACVFRRCHQSCRTSKDCPTDSSGERLRCMVGERPSNVCQLDPERVCERNSDCPENQLCALDNKCRDGCVSTRDCVAEQVCRSATCADVGELVDDQLVFSDSIPAVEKPCNYSSDCPPGPDGLTLLCRESLCTVGCFVQRDCARFFRCTTADDPMAPGDCELIGERGRLFCDPAEGSPDAERECDCHGQPAAAVQACKTDGSGFEDCPCP